MNKLGFCDHLKNSVLYVQCVRPDRFFPGYSLESSKHAAIILFAALHG